MQPNWNEERAHHWHLFSPPARPSPGEVSAYEREILLVGVNSLARWGLLGCTPELRSLAGKYDREMVCIDWNAAVHRILRSLVAGEVRESLVCSSWLDAEVERPVDLVLADGSVNMLPPERHDALMEKIAALLGPKGIAIMRVHLVTAPRFRTPAEVFAAARPQFGKEGVFTATRTDLDMLWIDPETLALDFELYHRRLRQLLDEGVINEVEYEPYDRLLPWNRIQLHYTKRAVFEEMARSRFIIERSQAGGDYTGSENHPVYTLRKK